MIRIQSLLLIALKPVLEHSCGVNALPDVLCQHDPIGYSSYDYKHDFNQFTNVFSWPKVAAYA